MRYELLIAKLLFLVRNGKTHSLSRMKNVFV